MYREDIEELNEWFEKKMKEQDEYFQTTYHHTEDGKDIYVVGFSDLEEFVSFIGKKSALIEIPCLFGTYGIWFTFEDLQETKYI